MSGQVKTFKVKDGDRNKKNNLTSFCIDDGKLLEKYKSVWTKIENVKNIELNVLSAYDNRQIKNKITTYNDKVYTNFRSLNVPEDVKFESITATYIDSLLLYNKRYYLQVYSDNCAYKIVSKQMTDYLEENLFDVQIL